MKILDLKIVLGVVLETFGSTVWLQEAPRQGSERAVGPKHRPKEATKSARRVPRCPQGRLLQTFWSENVVQMAATKRKTMKM